MAAFHTTIFISLFCSSFSAPQQPEINDQFSISDSVTEQEEPTTQTSPSTQEQPVQPGVETIKIEDTAVIVNKENETRRQIVVPEVSLSFRVYKFIADPIIKVITTPKVNSVLRNIGTCVVNGAMELFSYYLPAPFMPLIASAASLMIPFEPVVMLKEKMPVTSYRRAFQTAMTTFLRTFDKYKVEEDYDPYMTRRFNRRFINGDGIKKREKVDPADVE